MLLIADTIWLNVAYNNNKNNTPFYCPPSWSTTITEVHYNRTNRICTHSIMCHDNYSKPRYKKTKQKGTTKKQNKYVQRM